MKLGEWCGMLSVALLDSSGQPFLTEGSFFALRSHERGGGGLPNGYIFCPDSLVRYREYRAGEFLF